MSKRTEASKLSIVPGIGGRKPTEDGFDPDADPTGAEKLPPMQRGDEIGQASRVAANEIPDQWATLAESGLIVNPPIPPWNLVDAVQKSDELGPNIEAMAINISGHGLELEPLFPTTDENGKAVPPPKGAEEEKARLKLWIETCSPELGLAGVANLVDTDTEMLGYGAMEVLRSKGGAIIGLEHVPAWELRLGPLSEPQLVDLPIRDPNTGELSTVRRYRRFRSYVQIVADGTVRWFKEFGDPRHMNVTNGATRDRAQPAFRSVNGRSYEATELVFRRIYCPYSPYGLPRWVGAIPSVTAGRRAAELVNRWFDDGLIGAKAVAIAGGTFRATAVKRLTMAIDREGRGEQNAFPVFGIEADFAAVDAGADSTTSSAPRIAVFDLSTPPPADLYAGEESLMSTAGKRVAGTFRLPPVYNGRAQDYSRAAADTARAVGEEQVVAPARETRWHRWFSGVLLPRLGIRWWTLRFRASVTGDDVEAAAPLASLAAQGGVSPNALITVSNRITHGNEPRIKEAWGDRPMAITLAMLGAGKDPNGDLGQPDPNAAPVDGAPVDGAAPLEGAPGGAAAVQDTALNGAQVASLLEMLKAVSDGWLPAEGAKGAIALAFPLMDPTKIATMVDAIEEGGTDPAVAAAAMAEAVPPPKVVVAPGGGAGGGGGGKFGGPPKPGAVRATAAKIRDARVLEAVETVRALTLVRKQLEAEAVGQEFDLAAIAPGGGDA